MTGYIEAIWLLENRGAILCAMDRAEGILGNTGYEYAADVMAMCAERFGEEADELPRLIASENVFESTLLIGSLTRRLSRTGELIENWLEDNSSGDRINQTRWKTRVDSMTKALATIRGLEGENR